MSTNERLSAEEVSALSAKDLCEAVYRRVFGSATFAWNDRSEYFQYGSGDDGKILAENDAASVFAVIERMRQRWEEEEPDAEFRPRWSIEETEEGMWDVSVGARSCHPTICHDCNIVYQDVTAATLGRAVFEAALLIADISPLCNWRDYCTCGERFVADACEKCGDRRQSK